MGFPMKTKKGVIVVCRFLVGLHLSSDGLSVGVPFSSSKREVTSHPLYYERAAVEYSTGPAEYSKGPTSSPECVKSASTFPNKSKTTNLNSIFKKNLIFENLFFQTQNFEFFSNTQPNPTLSQSTHQGFTGL